MKTALVTGANRGIGRAIADGLQARGLRVIRTMRAPSEQFDQEVALELGDPASIASAAAAIATLAKHLDILVNNAAVHLDERRPLGELTADTLARTLAVNCVGTHAFTLAVLPLLKASPHGARIINLSSGAGQLSTMETFSPAYSISKTALNALTRQQAAHWKDEGIAVNCMCPGWCRTDMGGNDATRSAEEGADTALWLALEAPPELAGRFFRDREEIPW
jgi:NAD(P)-dependent dehydrogenase (short-subunit alcohol dehydrogenase family)